MRWKQFVCFLLVLLISGFCLVSCIGKSSESSSSGGGTGGGASSGNISPSGGGTGGGSGGGTAGKTTVTGVVADGYLQNARVCVDLNRNKKCDCKDEGGNEPCAYTDENGKYTLQITEDQKKYPIVAEVINGTTIDKDTGKPVDKGYVLEAPAPEDVKEEMGKNEVPVTPLTTLVKQQIDLNPGLTLKDAETKVKAKLGLTEENATLIDDYVAKESQDTTYKVLHRVAQVVAEAVGEALAQVKQALGTDYDNKVAYAVSVVVNTVVEKLDQVVTEIVKEVSSGNNVNATNIAQIANSTVVQDISNMTSNSTALNEKLEKFKEKLEQASSAEEKSPVDALIGQKLYGFDVDEDDGILFTRAMEVYFNGTSQNGAIEFKNLALSDIDSTSSFSNAVNYAYNNTNYYQTNGTSIEIKWHQEDTHPAVRIDKVSVIELANKTLKVSNYLFDTEEKALNQWDKKDTEVTFSEGDKAYCFSMTFLKQDPVEVARNMELDEDHCHTCWAGAPTYNDLSQWINDHTSANAPFENHDGGYPHFYFKPSDNDTLTGEVWAVDEDGNEFKVGRYYPVHDSQETYVVVDKGVYNHHGYMAEVFKCEKGKIYREDFHIMEQPWEMCLLNKSAFNRALDAVNKQ